MNEIAILRKKLDEEKAKEETRVKASTKIFKESEEKKRLKKELREIKIRQIKEKAKPILSFLGGLAKVGGKIGQNIETNEAKERYNVNVGDTIKIKNGIYFGQTMTIHAFISGGIEGRIGANSVRIRHGSYARV